MTDDSTQLTLDGADRHADDESTITNGITVGRSQPSSAGADTESDQRTEFHATALPEWRQPHEDADASYGFLEIYVTAITDLSGTQYSLGCRREIVHPDGDDLPRAMVGWGPATLEDVLDTIRHWRLNLLSQPYAPEIDLESHAGCPPVRTIPADRLRVFVAERVTDALQTMGHDDLAAALGPTVQRVNELPEHSISQRERDLVRTHADIITQIGAGGKTGTLQQRARQIERTIRAICGFTSRYGHEIPDPDPAPEFADLDLNTLKVQLDAVREEITQQEERLDRLSEQLDQSRKKWIVDTRETHRNS